MWRTPIHKNWDCAFTQQGEKRTHCISPLRNAMLFGGAPTGAEQHAAGHSWKRGLGDRDRQREEKPKQPLLLLAVRAPTQHGWEWQGLGEESPSSSQALLIKVERKIASFLSPSDPCFSEEGRKKKGLKHLALFPMQAGYKSISNKSYSHSSLLRASLFTVNPPEAAGFSGVLFLHANTW